MKKNVNLNDEKTNKVSECAKWDGNIIKEITLPAGVGYIVRNHLFGL